MGFKFKSTLLNAGGEPIFTGNTSPEEFLAIQFPNVDPVAEGWVIIKDDTVHILNPNVLPPKDLHDAALIAINDSRRIDYSLPLRVVVDFPEGRMSGMLSANEIRRAIQAGGWDGVRQSLSFDAFESLECILNGNSVRKTVNEWRTSLPPLPPEGWGDDDPDFDSRGRMRRMRNRKKDKKELDSVISNLLKQGAKIRPPY